MNWRGLFYFIRTSLRRLILRWVPWVIWYFLERTIFRFRISVLIVKLILIQTSKFGYRRFGFGFSSILSISFHFSQCLLNFSSNSKHLKSLFLLSLWFTFRLSIENTHLIFIIFSISIFMIICLYALLLFHYLCPWFWESLCFGETVGRLWWWVV